MNLKVAHYSAQKDVFVPLCGRTFDECKCDIYIPPFLFSKGNRLRHAKNPCKKCLDKEYVMYLTAL